MKNDNFADEEYDYKCHAFLSQVLSETQFFVLLLAVIKIMNLL